MHLQSLWCIVHAVISRDAPSAKPGVSPSSPRAGQMEYASDDGAVTSVDHAKLDAYTRDRARRSHPRSSKKNLLRHCAAMGAVTFGRRRSSHSECSTGFTGKQEPLQGEPSQTGSQTASGERRQRRKLNSIDGAIPWRRAWGSLDANSGSTQLSPYRAASQSDTAARYRAAAALRAIAQKRRGSGVSTSDTSLFEREESAKPSKCRGLYRAQSFDTWVDDRCARGEPGAKPKGQS